MKTKNIILAVIIVLLACVAMRINDERDYYQHQAYAEQNNCTWEWNEVGDWTICK